MEGKPLLKSKTFYFNVLAVLILVASQFGFQDFQANKEVLEIATALLPLGNIIIRLFTKEKITRLY